jgi:ribosomal protein L31
LSPDEILPAYTGRTQILDSEAENAEDFRNLRIDIGKGALKIYNQVLRNYQQDILKFCRSRDVEFLTISTADPIEKTLFNKGLIR